MQTTDQSTDRLFDLLYVSAQHPPALVNPLVWRGYFPRTKKGHYQKICFQHLLRDGFKRTPWQLVFPGQTAGLVKLISEEDGNEAHVRFYRDGIIACELEYHRFGNELRHLRGEHLDGSDYLRGELDDSDLSEDERNNIVTLIQERDYSNNLLMDVDSPVYQKWTAPVELAAVSVPVLTALYLWEYKLGPYLLWKTLECLTKQ